ncbi:hypothetical protein [Nonomuraea jiangxiensis]|uniref:Uncharacterized protein n=1 Tax=Nonomuraea jiangxiensis TaxID=633440 RepID=A0A1G8ICW6_9ACTN|nr:hypothetical protein [Nonomuraea jiangxiensis]SDI16400.1 hypothetical protein SAMN05421869_104442 [Nonomuraea jiangxiensis]
MRSHAGDRDGMPGGPAGHDVRALPLTGVRGGHPPAERETLLEFAGYRPRPGAYRGVRGDGRVTSGCPESVRRRRERLARSSSACW